MTKPPRRKSFQIHLSTTIVAIVVAGVLMWANLTPVINCTQGGDFVAERRQYGWPIMCFKWWFLTRDSYDWEFHGKVIKMPAESTKGNSWDYSAMTYDCLLAIGGILLTFFSLELAIKLAQKKEINYGQI